MTFICPAPRLDFGKKTMKKTAFLSDIIRVVIGIEHVSCVLEPETVLRFHAQARQLSSEWYTRHICVTEPTKSTEILTHS